jgi:NAD(P)H-flavin reductase
MELAESYKMARSDPLLPVQATIVARKKEYRDCVTLSLALSRGRFSWNPGQFFMVTNPGRGEVPLSISGGDDQGNFVCVTVDGVGPVTKGLCTQLIGQTVGIRGPYGHGWPIDIIQGKHVCIIAGGVGIAPLRPVIQRIAANQPEGATATIFLGAPSPSSLLYLNELDQLSSSPAIELETIVNEADSSWSGSTGIVTDLFDLLDPNNLPDIFFLCGPEPMMTHAAIDLISRQVDPATIYLSLERCMHCGVGWCGRCQFGPLLLCRDGPIVSWAKVSKLLSIAEI